MEALISLVIRKARARGWWCCTEGLIEEAARELEIQITPNQKAQVERLADFELDQTPWN